MKKMKLLIAALFAAVSFTPLSVTAQQDPIGSGLSISPTRTDLVVNEGTSADLDISVKNVTGGNIIAKAFINDFEPDGVSGEPRLITDSNVKSASSIKDFIVGLEDITLGVDETKEVKMQIDIPVGAAPGAYYGVIRYQAVPVDDQGQITEGGQVALTASVGTIVLVEVPGNIKQQIEIKSLSAYLDDKKGSLFTQKPTHIGIEIDNKGNGFARPFGKIYVKDMFGKEVLSYEMNNTNPRGVVLPESTRVFKDPVEGIGKPGRYTIYADVSYGNGGEVYSVSSTFWYVPSWLIITGLVLLLAIVGLAVFLYRKYVTKSLKRRR
ncbi:hypothetical protein KC992_01095 [Candidatus Saccharibacteria bacterium]|nr:hypothetical protein [Candidatus Saccharibacteria bacterium]